MLKHGRIYFAGRVGRCAIWAGCRSNRSITRHQITLPEMVDAVRVSKERDERLEGVIEEFVPTWSLAPIVRGLQTLRGVDLIVAVTFATEVGDVQRFESPR